MRSVNKAGVDLVKSFEGLFLKPYLCPAKVPTIGYGTIRYPNGTAVSLKDKPISEKEAEAYLIHELREKAAGVEKLVKVKLNDNEFAALVSFAYNVGLGALSGSTLLRLLNSNTDRVAVADQLLRWNKAGGKELAGLTRRRQAERSLFLQPTIEDSKKELLESVPSDQEIQDKLKQVEDDILKNN
jgi:lysozyme